MGLSPLRKAYQELLAGYRNLARLQATEGRQSEARKNLGAIYNWFTESFDTADLKGCQGVTR